VLAGDASGARWEVPACTVSRVLDTNGAGDAFNAGFLRTWADVGPARYCPPRHRTHLEPPSVVELNGVSSDVAGNIWQALGVGEGRDGGAARGVRVGGVGGAARGRRGALGGGPADRGRADGGRVRGQAVVAAGHTGVHGAAQNGVSRSMVAVGHPRAHGAALRGESGINE